MSERLPLPPSDGQPMPGQGGVAPAYTVEVRENGKRVSRERIVDPFISTRVHVRGWRAAWSALCRDPRCRG